MKINKKIIIKWLLVIIWMIIIFIFSNMNGDASNVVSEGLISKLLKFFVKLFNNNISNIEMNRLIEIFHVPIRKLAHITEYFILAILVFNALSEYKLKNIFIISLIICFIYACSDELHQLFINERAGSLIDILIDIFGSFIGLLLIKLKKLIKTT